MQRRVWRLIHGSLPDGPLGPGEVILAPGSCTLRYWNDWGRFWQDHPKRMIRR